MRIIIGLFGLWIMMLGLHGLYIAFSSNLVALTMADNVDKLFLSVNVPYPLKSWVSWVSLEGYKSWFFPMGISIIGLLLVYKTQLFTILAGFLKKIHLW